jgi:ubiquinone/menaquinone biosynthesis C-methylase UbiE
MTDIYDELPLWSAPFGLKLLEYIDYKPNISALDIGFGTGFPMIEIAMRLGTTSKVYGIDPCPETTETARQKIKNFGLTNVNIIEGSAEHIPLESGTIDLITSNNGINNVSDIGKVIAECSRVMKPGGLFIQTMNTSLTMFEFYEVLKDVLRERKMEREIQSVREHIALKRPSVEQIVSILRTNGFVIRDIEHDQFNYRFSDGTTMLNHHFIRLAFLDSWIRLIPEDQAKQVFPEVEKRLNELSRTLGKINLSIPFVLINAIRSGQ